MTTTTCLKGAPFDQVIHHYERVFVVAEVDDTYVYHIHLGDNNKHYLETSCIDIILLIPIVIIFGRDYA